MLTKNEIKELIAMDRNSKKKSAAKTGKRYYNGDHDIKKYRIFYFDSEGFLREDKKRSNVKIPHTFFTEIVNQSVQYIFSGGRIIRSDKSELQTELDNYFNYNEDFTSNLQQLLTGCISKGSEYMYMYKNSDGKTAFQCCDYLNVIEVTPLNSLDGKSYIIYMYNESADKGKKEITHIQVWDDEMVHFFCRENGGDIKGDDSEKINPCPHNLYSGNDGTICYDSFGCIPFFRLDNNPEQASDLKLIKELIDDYDLMASSLSNNLIDFDTPLYAVSGFEGDSVDQLQQNLRTKKIIGLDEGGTVDVKTVDIPHEARKEKLELDEKNIYRFGMGLNTVGLRDTVSTTNIAIKAAYSLLDLKCQKLETRLKQFLRQIVRPVLDEINSEYGTDYKPSDVWFEFKHEVMSNALENARIESLNQQSMKTKIQNIKDLAEFADEERISSMIKEAIEEYDI